MNSTDFIFLIRQMAAIGDLLMALRNSPKAAEVNIQLNKWLKHEGKTLEEATDAEIETIFKQFYLEDI